MIGKILCWLGFHKYEEYPAVVTKYSTLIAHRCKRCHMNPPKQQGLGLESLAEYQRQREGNSNGR